MLPKRKRPFLTSKVKERNLLIPGWRVLSGYGVGLVSRPVGVFPTGESLKSDRFEYTYDGNRRSFNIAHRYKERFDGHQNPAAVTLYREQSLGWDGVSMWERPTINTGLPPLVEVAWVPYNPRIIAEDKGCEGAAFNAYQSVMASRPDQFMNIGRSLIELKDTGQTARGLLDFVRWAATSCAGRFKAGASVLEMAKIYLTVKFGIEPTVSDAVKFLEQAKSEKIRLLQVPLRWEKGSVMRAGYKITLSTADLNQLCGLPANGCAEQVFTSWIGSNGTFTVPNSSTYSRPWVPSSWNIRRIQCVEYRGVIFGRLTKTIELDTFNRKLRSWEWSCPISKTMWDLVPFSFLVDWFIDIGSVLERLDRTHVPAEIKPEFVNGLWHSATRAVVIKQPVIMCGSRVSVIGEPQGGYPMWNVRTVNSAIVSNWVQQANSETYSRAPYVPPISVLFPTFRWKLKAYQLSTGAALLINMSQSLKRLGR